MTFEISLTRVEAESLRRKLEALDSNVKEYVQKGLAGIGFEISRTAKNLAPVKTGYLRSTIHSETRGWTVSVGARAPYAFFVEFGTRHFAGRRFLTRALETHLPRVHAFLDDAVARAVESAKAVV